MNNPGATKIGVSSKPGISLLDTIRTIRAEVGDGLTDEEFTRLLHQMELPVESGFGFLCYCDRFVTLSVPRQQLADWYPENGWIMPAKESNARNIAEKYGLSLCEPPDVQFPWLGSPNPHHHLQLSNQQEPVIIIHPQYLKIRLFVATSPARSARTSHKPLPLGPDLLADLSAFYGD
ncbi:MAG: hypothetical protein JWQ04_2322 [Pedosphaera sp.]|nr:hypothetical protein [Pedosphaera sp.]